LKRGRPTHYKPEYCEALIEHMAEGKSFESFGADIDCHRQTLYDWCNKHADFAYAKKVGSEKSWKWWEKLVIDQATGKIDGNATMIIFALKNRFGWHDKQEVQHTHQLKPSIIESLDGRQTILDMSTEQNLEGLKPMKLGGKKEKKVKDEDGPKKSK